MVTMGEATILVKVDAHLVLDVIAALTMMTTLLDDRYGHEWTDDEWATLEKAAAACERQNLVAEALS